MAVQKAGPGTGLAAASLVQGLAAPDWAETWSWAVDGGVKVLGVCTGTERDGSTLRVLTA